MCPSGYNGSLCDEDIDECENRPCANGKCKNTNDSFECECDDGYDGPPCDIDDCRNLPCQNGGTCKDSGTGSYECTCASGWTGKNCTDVDCTVLHPACSKCEGFPAKCIECAPNYVITADGECGKCMTFSKHIAVFWKHVIKS